MKKIYIFTAVLALLTLSLNAQDLKATKGGKVVQPKSGQVKAPNRANRASLTVCDVNTTTYDRVPFYGWYHDMSNTTVQMIYPASMLTVMNGGTINSVKFYSDNGVQFSNGQYTVTMGMTDQSTISELMTISGTTATATYVPTSGQTEIEITFSPGLIYTPGKNLIIETKLTTTGTCDPSGNHTYFVGVNQTYNCSYGNKGSTDAQKFLPKATFGYDAASSDPTIYASPSSVSFNAEPGANDSQTVTVSGLNLSGSISANITGPNAGLFSVNPTSLNASSGTLTVTYSPTASGTHTATLTLSSSGADPVDITLNGNCVIKTTICDGTGSNIYLPIYAYYYDDFQKNQMIYPASELTHLVGTVIRSMTFYAKANFGSFGNGQVTARLGTTTDQANYSSKVRLEPTDMKVVASGFDVPSSGNTWTIVFTDPFEYNGGNLVVDMEVIDDDGSYGSQTFGFYGVTQTGGGFNSYYGTYNSNFNTVYTNGTVQDFLPKVTFAYIEGTPRHDLGIALSLNPTTVVAGEATTITATVTNNGNQTENGFTVTITDGNGNTIDTRTVNETLAPGASSTPITITYTTTAAQGGTNVSINANVACTDDANLNDNDATASLQVNAQVQDLAIALNAPASVVGGNSATVTATVTNTGNQPMTGYTVTITDGTNNLLNQTATEPLAPGATATYSAEYNTTAAQVGNTVNFAANVTCADDADATNNSATASMEVITMPAPENVVATPNGQNATVTWDAPSNLPIIQTTVTETVTENFDDTSVFPSFSIGGITATQHTGTIGDWTVYTPSSDYVYGPRNVTFENDNDPQAWAVMNPTAASWNIGSAHSGSQFMISFCDAGDENGENIQTTNHWLISPELSGNDQTITFWERVITTQYGDETYEVLASSTDNNPASFSLVESFTSDATSWTQRTASLPAGTKYFAIRHTSNDIFGVMIDDVTYEIAYEDNVELAPVSYNIYLDGELVGNVAADAALTYNFSNLAAGEHTASVSAVYPGNVESAKVPDTFTILPTPNAPAVSSNDGTTSTTITITPDANTDGQLVYYVDYNGSQTQDLTFPRGETDYQVTVHAYTEATANYNQSPEAVVTVTIPALPQTAAPSIGISSQTDNEVVITATGNGTVTLTINGQTVEGDGSASITLPRQMQDYNVTASATAQVSGELISPTTTETITVPGMSNDGWTQMTGTYNNPNDLLSFKVKVGNDTTDIMMIDQFLAPTIYNDHPSSYTYVLKETKVINGVDSTMTSNPATIPVYKTNSTMYSLYTEEEVLADNKYDDNKLKANVLNSEIDYDVVPDNNVLYYSLYRGGKDEPTPVVDVDHRISQLQKFEDKVGDNVTYYLTENHLSGITPRYEHIGSQTVERLDTNYVIGTDENKLSYVPVIWTFGLYTARGDGKNNSYGSDIKESYLGKVDISVAGYKNDGDSITGQWKDDQGTTYCVYAPIITLHGFTPEDVGANDGDTYQYVPYMYRVWCTYTNAHNFTFLDNPDGRKHLVDAGPIEAPFLIGEVTADNPAWNNTGEEVIIGRALESGEAQQPWSFGVPVTEPSKNVEFVARFYYKKIVTPAAQVNGLRGNRGDARAFAIAEKSGDGKDITTGISELGDITYVVSRTYVNAQGMQSDVPFDGLNIVITRYSDGTTSTTKVVR